MEESDWDSRMVVVGLAEHVYHIANRDSFRDQHRRLAPGYVAIFLTAQADQRILFEESGVSIEGTLGKGVVVFSHMHVSAPQNSPMILIPLKYKASCCAALEDPYGPSYDWEEI